jgi:Domain of unknown function (DUF4124)
MHINNSELWRALDHLYTGVRFGVSTALVTIVLSGSSQAAIYRCVDANGTNVYSDKPCAPSLPAADEDAAARAHRTAAPANPAERAMDAKAGQILQLLRLTSSPESDSAAAQRTVDLIAPDLVKQLDPANPAWTPQQPKWHTVLEFVKADLRKDVQPALRASSLQSDQAAAHEYALHAQITDMDELLKFLSSPDGARYIAFQNLLRLISNQALESLMAQEPITPEEPSDAVLKHREQLLSLGIESRIAADGVGTPRSPSSPGSSTMLQNTARREGTALDALFSEYGASLPSFTAFTQSTTARRFFTAVEPALRMSMAQSSIAAGVFADTELTNYGTRWVAFYGPPVRGSGRVTTVVRARSIGVVSTRQVNYDGGRVARESAAIQCEQREDATYTRTHPRTSQINSQAALKEIQNTCRNEQNLPAL